MNVNVNINNMLNAVSIATFIINNSIQTAQIFDALNSVLRAVTKVYESINSLTSWLDRFFIKT